MPRDNPSCTITTSLGNFTAEIFLRQMPLTAANFIDLVEKRFYDGTHVHLLAPKMVLGMGCPHSKDPHSSKAGTGAAPDGSAFRAPDGRLVERLPGGYVRDEVGTEQLSNYAGTLAMINLGRPDSCSSQFVINCDHNRWADAWELESPASHFVFGKLVRRGDLDVAKKAARGATADDDRPADPIKVVRIRMGTRVCMSLRHASGANGLGELYLRRGLLRGGWNPAERQGSRNGRAPVGTSARPAASTCPTRGSTCPPSWR